MNAVEVEPLDAFRLRARDWLRDNAQPYQEAQPGGDESRWDIARDFQRRQHEAGLSGIWWPVEYGGWGLTMAHQKIFNEEASGYFLPSGLFQITLSILGMTLLDHGTEEQKCTYLPGMLKGEALWGPAPFGARGRVRSCRFANPSDT